MLVVPDGPDLQAAGYDELEFLQDATEDDVEELCEFCEFTMSNIGKIVFLG